MKREIRVLGLDACNDRRIVGVVTRGGLYLDGVLTFEKEVKASDLARNIAKTKYFPELKLIMIHGSTPQLNSSVIESATSLPVMTIAEDSHIHDRRYKSFSTGRQRVSVKTRMDTRTTQDILRLTSIWSRLPEPVRIAHLLGRVGPPNPAQTR